MNASSVAQHNREKLSSRRVHSEGESEEWSESEDVDGESSQGESDSSDDEEKPENSRVIVKLQEKKIFQVDTLTLLSH
tara:strand:+ start:315 stop:548 length:234 start_codon:yes stop_codon:yes gene_type:complete